MLYKQLNELRTQGEWVYKPCTDRYMCPIDFFEVSANEDINWIAQIANPESRNEKQNKANAAYTCLAVNNLHHLAEALEYFASLPLAYAEMQGMTKEVIKAKEALNRIS